MTARLEHANISVRDVEETLRFLQAAMPEFRIRHDETDADGRRWVHVGTDDTYIAVNNAREKPNRRWQPYAGFPGVNHLAYEVDDAEALRQRLLAAGFEESTVPNSHPHRRRVYFHDTEGNDWEFVEYLSEAPAQRNDYELADR